MKAHELRIGNYVRFGDDPCEVYEIHWDFFYIKHKGRSLKSTWAEIEPIPLTEQWLEDFGFEKHKCGISGADMWQGMDGWSKDDNELFSGWLFRGYRTATKFGETELKLTGYFNSSVVYVHQLQNLYFALTGKELTKR